jgi:hypothetical protein
MTLARIVTLAFLVTVLAACGGTGDDPLPPPSPDAGPTVGAEPGPAGEWRTCRNEQAAATIAFPGDWFTNVEDALPACSIFDPEAIDLPETGEVPPALAIVVRREDVAQAELVEEDMFEEQLSREEVEVDGRPAVRIESEATGAGLLDAGTRSYRYYVDLDGDTLIAETHDVEGTDFERNRRILDDMMAQVRIDG